MSLARRLEELKVPPLAGQGTRVVALLEDLDQSIILDGWDQGLAMEDR